MGSIHYRGLFLYCWRHAAAEATIARIMPIRFRIRTAARPSRHQRVLASDAGASAPDAASAPGAASTPSAVPAYARIAPAGSMARMWPRRYSSQFTQLKNLGVTLYRNDVRNVADAVNLANLAQTMQTSGVTMYSVILMQLPHAIDLAGRSHRLRICAADRSRAALRVLRSDQRTRRDLPQRQARWRDAHRLPQRLLCERSTSACRT